MIQKVKPKTTQNIMSKALLVILTGSLCVCFIVIKDLDKSVKSSEIEVEKLHKQIEEYTDNINEVLDEYDSVIAEVEERANMAVESVDSLHEYMIGRSIEVNKGWWTDFPDTKTSD